LFTDLQPSNCTGRSAQRNPAVEERKFWSSALAVQRTDDKLWHQPLDLTVSEAVQRLSVEEAAELY